MKCYSSAHAGNGSGYVGCNLRLCFVVCALLFYGFFVAGDCRCSGCTGLNDFRVPEGNCNRFHAMPCLIEWYINIFVDCGDEVLYILSLFLLWFLFDAEPNGCVSSSSINMVEFLIVWQKKIIICIFDELKILTNCILFDCRTTVPGYQSNLAAAISHSSTLAPWERFGIETILTFFVVLTYFMSTDSYKSYFGVSSLSIGAVYTACSFVSVSHYFFLFFCIYFNYNLIYSRLTFVW